MAVSLMQIRKYIWLADTIRRAGRITLKGINECWSRSPLNSLNEPKIPERTFHRYRKSVEELLDIIIDCDRTTNQYYITYPGELSKPVFTSWLFNGLALDNLLLANEGVADRILFEPIFAGQNYLPILVDAMSGNRKLQFSYRRFDSEETNIVVIEPYFLKQNCKRWYIIGRPENSNLLDVYALDRVNALSESGDTFEYDEELAKSCDFSEVIGINRDDDYDSITVIVRVFGNQRAYFESLPLHPSQKCIAQAPKYSDYEFYLRPEYEFQHAILALGPSAEVLEPEWLRNEFKWYAKEMLKHYK